MLPEDFLLRTNERSKRLPTEPPTLPPFPQKGYRGEGPRSGRADIYQDTATGAVSGSVL